MKRIIGVYGAIGGVIVAAGMLVSIAAGVHSVLLGYASMLIALSMVFIGVKRFRDEHKGGVIGFWQAFAVGLGISLVASLFYAVSWEVYLYATNYSFMAEYSAGMVQSARAEGASEAEIAKMIAEFDSFADTYANPLLRFLITLSEIAPVALFMTVISAALLRNSNFMPARKSG